ncbi:MAG: PD40 domain-containing protein [Acidobacteria bacterium]|nr:PD40 domain-containing protein [Acidobacteriota bacterium]
MDGEQQQKIFFAEFELDTAHRRLLRSGEPCALYAKAYDLLEFLVKNNGRIVSKDEILETVWEGQFVEEANLSVQISALRKALGERRDAPRFLVTIPGKGYKFTAELDDATDEIVIEKHHISQLTIRQETEIDTGPETVSIAPRNFPALEAPRRRNWPRYLLLAAAVGLIALTAGWTIFRFYNRPKPVFLKTRVTRLTNNGRVAAAAVAPDGKYFAYVLSEPEGRSLWIQQVGTASNIRLLPPVKADFWQVVFSPDGAYIYYNLFSPDKTNNELFRIPSLGGLAEKIPGIIGYAVSFAPDGRRFAYVQPDSEAGLNSLMIADIDGANRQTLAVKPQPNTFVFDGELTAWSPDGATLAVFVNHLEAGTNYYNLVGVDVRSGTERNLCDQRWRDVPSLEWLRDGSGLLVSGIAETNRRNRIWLVPQPDGEVRPLTDDLNDYSSLKSTARGNAFVALQTTSLNALYAGPADGAESDFREIVSEVGPLDPLGLMPDGKIVFRSSADGAANLWRIDADGANRRQLTANLQVDERGMCVSGDGKYIVFTSWRSGKSNLWRVDADGGNPRQLTDGEADANPSCAADGRSVVFQRGILSQPHLWKVSIDGGEPVRLTDFNAKWSALSTNGAAASYFFMKDDRWQIGILDAETGVVRRTLDVPAALSGRRTQWSPADDGLFFVAAGGDTGNVWKLPLDGSAARPVTNFKSKSLDDFLFTRDGAKLVVARSTHLSDVVLIENAE